MTDLSPSLRAAIEARCKQATPGPWVNADFIAHAREDVPVLLAEVDRLAALVTEIQQDKRAVEGERSLYWETSQALRAQNTDQYERRVAAEASLDTARGLVEAWVKWASDPLYNHQAVSFLAPEPLPIRDALVAKSSAFLAASSPGERQ